MNQLKGFKHLIFGIAVVIAVVSFIDFDKANERWCKTYQFCEDESHEQD